MPQTQILDSKTLTLYPAADPAAPLVADVEFQENGADILAAARAAGAPDFHLLTVSGLNWDEDLSPWPSRPVVSKEDHFTGQASVFADFLTRQALAWALEALPQADRRLILAGYSMAGLFALYAATRTSRFEALVSCSGSLWFPDFEAYARTTPFVRDPRSIYLSLGDKESKVKSPVLQTTEPVTRSLADFYADQGIQTVYVAEKGNHFKDPAGRLGRGIAWTLTR